MPHPQDGSGQEERGGPAETGEQATIRLLFLQALCNAVPPGDGRMDTLLREHGFYRSQLNTPYERAPLHRYIALLEHAAERLKRPNLGLEMGSGFGLAELGPFQPLLRAAGTVRAALETMALFQGRWQTRTMLEARSQGDHTIYSYRIEDPAIWPRRQDAEFVVGGFVTLIRQLTSPKWCPAEVHLEHPVAGREDALFQFFRARVLGNQVANALVIADEDLDRPFSGATPQEDLKLKAILECHLLDLMGPETTAAKDFVAQAEDAIVRRLGRTHVDCDSIAAELNMSGRSFRRRLMEEGTSYRTILQRARQARARAILEAPDVPLSVAAEQLGYSDTATFSRAFKEWTGVSPGRFARKPE